MKKLLLAALLLCTSAANADVIGYSPGKAATSQSTVSSTTAPTSTASFTMMGLAGSITPTKCGAVQITISGTIGDFTNTVANVGILLQVSYGTGSAPTSNAALTGTQYAATYKYTAAVAPTAAADVSVPFSTQAVITGLTVGTAYWLDLAQKAVTTTGQYSANNLSITAAEIC